LNNTTGPDGRLKRSTLLYFSLPDYAVYLAAIPVSLYLPFVYSRDLGLELTDIGLILMLARISDVITDPLIGYLSDRTQSRFGKRKPWLAAGSVVMMFSAWQLFAPSGAVDNWHLLIWSMLLWLGWTMINIPYFAWGAELSEDYHERTRITGWRQFFGYLGNVSVLLIPTLSGQLFGYGSLPQEGLYIVGFMALVLLPVLMFFALWKVPEPTKHRTTEVNLLKSSKQMFSNGSFMLLFTGFLMLSMGTTWASSMFMLLATFVVEVEGDIQLILLGFYFINLLSLPVWIKISYRIGKRETWLLGAAIFCIASPGYMMLGSGDVAGLIIVLGLYGIAGGNFGAISLSMKADVIDIAALRTGNHVAGSYMAIWSLGTKLFQALAIGLALPAVSLLGFDPNGTNGPDELRALSLNITIIPMILYGSAVFVIWRYPLSAARLERLHTAFQRRKERQEARAA
jgi:GPH family glycoside/pentoside/hexuronide:cation symporter